MAEQLLRTGLSATTIQPDAATADLPARAQTVVVGAGIVGASVAYHLARLGQEVLVLDRASVSAGTSWHAAGLVAHGRASDALTALGAYGIELYARLQAETGVDVNFVRSGSLLLARTSGRMDELAETAVVARRTGVPHALLSPEQIHTLVPLLSTEALLGGLHQPDDGHVNPGLAALALATGAHAAGARFAEQVRVTGIRTADDRVVAVQTDRGEVACEQAVLATGLWTRDLAEACGASVPLYPAEHVHVRSRPVTGVDPLMPVVRDMDASLYLRHLNGCVLVGAFEAKGKPLDPRSLPDDFAFGELPEDWDHFAPIRGMAEQRMPVLADVGYERFLNAPESFTPDANFCLGETAEVDGLWVAAGFNSQGIIFAPGAGRALAEWIVQGTPSFDVATVDVQRFDREQANRRYLHERTREGLGRLYAMHWPHQHPETARGVRRSPLHDRLVAAGARFGEVNGFETATWYAPAGTEPDEDHTFGRPRWYDHAAAEQRGTRDAVGLVDRSGSTILEMAGADAAAVVGGPARTTAELRVVQRAPGRVWALAPIGSRARLGARLRRAVRGRAAVVTDASAAYAHLVLLGPRSLELFARVSDLGAGGLLEPGQGREVEVGRGYAWWLRDADGLPGVELFPPVDLAVDVYDHLLAAGQDLGLVHVGLHAFESLRVRLGAGAGTAVVRMDDPDVLLRGGETVEVEGGPVGRVTLAAYDDAEDVAHGVVRGNAPVPVDVGCTVDTARGWASGTLHRPETMI